MGRLDCSDKCKVLGPIIGVSLELICQERATPHLGARLKFFFFPLLRPTRTLNAQYQPFNNTLFETTETVLGIVFVSGKCNMTVNCASNLFSLGPGVTTSRVKYAILSLSSSSYIYILFGRRISFYRPIWQKS